MRSDLIIWPTDCNINKRNWFDLILKKRGDGGWWGVGVSVKTCTFPTVPLFHCVRLQQSSCTRVCVCDRLKSPVSTWERRGCGGGRNEWKREWNEKEKGKDSSMRRRRRRRGLMCRGLYELWRFPTVADNRWRQGSPYDNRLFDPGQASRGKTGGGQGCPHLPQKRKRVCVCP